MFLKTILSSLPPVRAAWSCRGQFQFSQHSRNTSSINSFQIAALSQSNMRQLWAWEDLSSTGLGRGLLE